MRTIGIHKDCDERCGASTASAPLAFVDKSHRLAISKPGPFSVWKLTDEIGFFGQHFVDHGAAVSIESTPNMPLRFVEIGLHCQVLRLVCLVVINPAKPSQSRSNASKTLNVETFQ